MIELIFVIVIIGILAAVAIPKLAATRSDAEGAKIANNLATCVNDAGGAYLKDGNFTSVTTDADAAAWTAANVDTVACDSALDCFDFNASSADGTLTIKHNDETTKKCVEAQRLGATNKTSSAAGETHSF